MIYVFFEEEMEWNGMEWDGLGWNGVEWEWNGILWNGMDSPAVSSFLLQRGRKSALKANGQDP